MVIRRSILRIYNLLGLVGAVLILGAFYPSIVFAQKASFAGEYIQFQIRDSVCMVEAEYEFKNPAGTPSQTRLFYPIPVDETQAFPSRFVVSSALSGEELPFKVHPGGISFLLEIDPLSSQTILVNYWQNLGGNQFKYILTSTQNWGQPLDWVCYEIDLPGGLVLDFCSLEVDTSIVCNDHTLYRIERQNFLPSSDLEMRWGNHQ